MNIYRRSTKNDEAIASASLAASSSKNAIVQTTKDEQKKIIAIGRGVITLTPEIFVCVAALAVFGRSVRSVDPWNDELVTLIVASWPVSAIMKLAEHKDLVHAVYYTLVHPFLVVDREIMTARLLSVVAMTVAAVVLVRIGRALDGWPVGLGAGSLLIVSVTASRYAQEARSYALVVMLATLSTLMLIRAIERPRANRRWAIYSVLLVATALVNIIGTLIILAHALWLCQLSLAHRAAVIVRWCVATVLAGAALTPYAVLAVGQSRQVGWITRSPGLDDLKGIAALAWIPGCEVGLFALITVVVVGVLGTPGARTALVLGLVWGLMPPLTLWIVSQIHPLYESRYVLFAVPGMALALGSLAGLRFVPHLSPSLDDNVSAAPSPAQEPARRGWRTTASVALVAIPIIALGLAGLPQQRAQRLPNGHGENLRGVAQVLTAESRSGDGVVYLPYWLRVMKAGFPLPNGVEDLTLARDGPSTAEIAGWQVTPEQAVERLDTHCRVWAVTKPGILGDGPTDDAVARELPARFDLTRKYAVERLDVLLFVSREACGSAR